MDKKSVDSNKASGGIPPVIWLPQVIYSSRKLTPNAKLILSEILNLLKLDRRYCWASNKHFADMFGLEEENVSYHIQQIKKDGWIKCESVKICKMDTCSLKDTGWHRHIYPGNTLSNILDTLTGIDTTTQIPPLSNKLDSPIKDTWEPPYQVYAKQDIHKDTKDKSLVGTSPKVSSKVDKRDPQVQAVIDKLILLKGEKPAKEHLNRYAAKRLVRSKGLDRVVKALDFAWIVRSEDRFAPRIYSVMDLEEKWDALLDYGKARKQPKQKTLNEMVDDYPVLRAPRPEAKA